MVYRSVVPRSDRRERVPSGKAPEGADDVLDATFAALAHRSRRELLRLVLDADGPLAMSDLATSAGISPQLLNKHAAALERAGLIRRVPRGRERHVYANPEAMASAQQWITEMTSFWSSQLDALEQYVAGVAGADDPDPQED
jgi:predicted transcriptional regulator